MIVPIRQPTIWGRFSAWAEVGPRGLEGSRSVTVTGGIGEHDRVAGKPGAAPRSRRRGMACEVGGVPDGCRA